MDYASTTRRVYNCSGDATHDVEVIATSDEPGGAGDETNTIVGSTRYHDIVPAIDRVEIGYTWYGASRQRTHVNSACKLLLLSHAFDALGCAVVGLRTDNFNFRSQAAIAALGAKRDGVLRHHQARRDGTVRDSVMFSILAPEWPDVRRHLELRLARSRERSP